MTELSASMASMTLKKRQGATQSQLRRPKIKTNLVVLVVREVNEVNLLSA